MTDLSMSFGQCPVGRPEGDLILLAHGEGARLTRRLIRDEILAAFDHPILAAGADAAVLPDVDGSPVLTTDSFVVTPIFFPGGDIGRLAVHGTVNDLAVVGADPLHLAVSLILEEGLSLADLRRVLRSMRDAARECGVSVVTGDTKVVPRGAADRMFVTTTGLGRLRPGTRLGADRVRPGDRVIVSGTIGDHGMAILAAREGFAFNGALRSDTAPLHELTRLLLDSGIAVRWMRDPTRGGVAAVLHELAEASRLGVEIVEAALPVSPAVRGACELLGLDPLFVANEGKLLAVVAAEKAGRAVDLMRGHTLGRDASEIGEIVADGRAEVRIRTPFGGLRPLDEPSGAPLPRIC
jgi:hydrogenase expression/formation protein HypE